MKKLVILSALLAAVAAYSPSTAEARSRWHVGINSGPFWYGGGWGGHYGGWAHTWYPPTYYYPPPPVYYYPAPVYYGYPAYGGGGLSFSYTNW